MIFLYFPERQFELSTPDRTFSVLSSSIEDKSSFIKDVMNVTMDLMKIAKKKMESLFEKFKLESENLKVY
jgi:hypothetical protein